MFFYYNLYIFHYIFTYKINFKRANLSFFLLEKQYFYQQLLFFCSIFNKYIILIIDINYIINFIIKIFKNIRF